MLQAFLNIWRIPELRNKMLFTLGMLVIYRIGFFIPLPAVDQAELAEWAKNAGGGAGTLLNFVGMFTGGSLHQSTIFGLGIAPYISAAIIFQLLGTVVPSFQALQKEGPAGQQKLTEWTRYATVGLCIVQAVVWLGFLQSGDRPLVYPDYLQTPTFWICGLVGLTAGTIFLMWIGEQIDKYGIGNGVSLIITAGIVARMPQAVLSVIQDSNLPYFFYDHFTKLYLLLFKIAPERQDDPRYGLDTAIFLMVAFVVVVAGSILITQGQRRIPIQQAKHTRGRRVYGGQKTYLPLRVNHGGVMPIIFASTLMVFPSMIFNFLANHWRNPVTTFLQRNFAEQGYLHVLSYIALIYFFAYFWTTVQFQPKEMATQLRDHGSFIPGMRPGPRTAEYLEVVMERITYVGAGFLAIIAVIPTVVSSKFNVDPQVASFLGGTGLLIVVSVMLDFVNRIEASLAMRNYQGFLGGGGGGKGPRIRGAGPM
ncbi:MAG: preprotein translocase subunit SecY [Phycisphaeraceae bacterium]|nr:preprotein translocase subunit SecY [Phycisphaeraceae bacterium]